jgi:HSP20 family protein
MPTIRHAGDRFRLGLAVGDEFVEQVLKLAGGARVHPAAAWWPSLDVFEVEDGFVVIAELAGVRPDDIELCVEGPRLHLTGVRHAPPVTGPHAVRQLEIDYGPFARTIALDPAVDEAGIVAEYRAGLLLVKLPRRATRRVRIDVED